MKKHKIIYSLSTRGMYSELFNLCLAIVYARHYQKSLKLNTWLWNSRIKKGWLDYFEPTLDCSNNPFPAQDKVYTNEKPWIGKIYYKPKEFFSFYYRLILNYLYHILHPDHLLTKDIFEDMRSKEFIHDILGKDAFSLMASSFKQMYVLNNKTKDYLKLRINGLRLPDDYIGVHVRRGDKITSKEMQDIRLDKYINTIINYKSISSNVYIATDDTSIIHEIKKKLCPHGFNIFYNSLNQSTGFVEANFNNASKQARQEETINVLLDMDVLIHSNFFIGTYTSNLSRVVPFFLGLDKCISLDNDWNIINSMNGM
ncbi:MAG: O-fucosyltransferase family protein [Prevotella sp.]|nr:O-fucosyltransferase family protein [Prevotella sp.]